MRRRDESGVVLVSALLVLMLMSGLLIGFMALVAADQQSGWTTQDQTKAHAAAHAGLEKLSADLDRLFRENFSPTVAQVKSLEAGGTPRIPGVEYRSPDGTLGYKIDVTDKDGDGYPDLVDPLGSPIESGLKGLITRYWVTVTARTTDNAEVRLRRQVQTVAVPVFQFGIFSENDQSFFAGPDFSFGGRVHTNQNLFLKQDNSKTLTLTDRVTAVGEVIRTHLANGYSSHFGSVRVAKTTGCVSAPEPMNTACVEMGPANCSGAACLGSKVTDLSSGNNPGWLEFSNSTTEGYVKNHLTGAKRLELPLTSEGAEPIDIIRRPRAGESTSSPVYAQRFYSMATLRILLSDTAQEITSLPGVVATPMPLVGTFTPIAVDGAFTGNLPFATSSGNKEDGYRTQAGTASIGGFITIERQSQTGQWSDVTREILSLGFVGRNPSRNLVDRPPVPDDDPCAGHAPPVGYANAIIRVQRFRDNPTGDYCHSEPGTSTNYWPNVLYDAREGALRDQPTLASNGRVFWGGVMHYVELDVANLKRWLEDDIGTNGPGSMHTTGYVVYFSDRRTNKTANSSGVETGEFGFEDFINPASGASVANGRLDAPVPAVAGTPIRYAEDVNGDGALQNYGGSPRWGGATRIDIPSGGTPASNNYNLFTTPIDIKVARVNRAMFFRRALKVVNGGLGQLPSNPENAAQGLTIASENLVYVQGNFNACAPNVDATAANGWSPECVDDEPFGDEPGEDHVSAAIIADAVTVLSNAWNDIRSFRNPHDVENQTRLDNMNARQAVTTYYRMGIIAGKGLNFTRPTSNTTHDHMDFGTDGGAHNFIRYLEAWGSDPDGSDPLPKPALHYRGSLISLYTSRQAVGTYKCCGVVYTAPERIYKFDDEFLTPGWLPPRTPMFRDVDSVSFRQVLSPTEP